MAIYTILICLLTITVASLLHLLFKKIIQKGESLHKLPPGPKKLPIIGNLHQLGQLPHHSLWLLSQKHGPLMHLQLGRIPTLVVSSAEMAREVLKTHDLNFCTRPQLTSAQIYSYNGVDISFSPYCEYWRQMRKICILELFSIKRVESFRFIREEEISRMVQSIQLSSGNTINLSKMMSDLPCSIICRVALGKKYQGEEYEKSPFQVYEVLQEAQAMLGGFFFADFFPMMGYWIDKLRGVHGRLEKNISELDAFYEQVVEEHLDPARKRPEHEDIVDVLIRLQKDGGHITKVNIKAIVMDIFVAGTETASATIIWAMSELVRNPKAMKKAQEEVRGSLISKGKVEERDLNQLQYLKAVVKETLRLHLPVPLLIPRETIRHCKIGGYDILPNTRVYINAWGIGRDPKTWEDAEMFIPERFINNSIDFRGHDFQFIPFGSGRRICPAMNSGVLVIELALANLLYYFDWELPAGMTTKDMEMNEAPGLTVHRKSALQLVAKVYGMK